MVTLYSNDCPRCKMVKASLDAKKIPYEIVSDEKQIVEMAEKHGVMSLPFAVIEGIFYGSKELQKWVIAQEG